MIAFTDSAGTPLSGGSNYRLNLPPNIPAANFWSVTLYDAENSSGLANGQPFPSLGSRDKPAQNADGSTDLYLGPKAPEGKARQLARDCAGQGVFRHPQALRPDGSCHQQELEAGRHRKGEVNVRPSLRHRRESIRINVVQPGCNRSVSNNVVSFSRNVVLSGLSFSINVVSK